MNWLELSVTVDRELVEPISELFARYGYNGGIAIDEPFTTSPETMAYRVDAARPVTVRTYLANDEQAEEKRQQLEESLWHLSRIQPLGELQIRQINDEDWANAWKAHYTILHIGERTVIVPSWLEYEPKPYEVVLRLDPGMAFGTGTHPTTQLCLEVLEQTVQPNALVLDLGCGSGILAVAAAKLGARRVLALDTDPIAISATRENCERNDAQAVVQAAVGSLGAGVIMGHWLGWEHAGASEPPQLVDAAGTVFDLVVANIIAGVLVALANDLATALAPHGLLIASGIIVEREPEVVAAFESAGLSIRERRTEGDWVALVAGRTSAT